MVFLGGSTKSKTEDESLGSGRERRRSSKGRGSGRESGRGSGRKSGRPGLIRADTVEETELV